MSKEDWKLTGVLFLGMGAFPAWMIVETVVNGYDFTLSKAVVAAILVVGIYRTRRMTRY